MALGIPVPAVAAYVPGIVKIVEQSESGCQQVMIGRDGLGKLHSGRISVALFQITEDLIVGSVFLLDEDHVFDVLMQERHHRIGASLVEGVVSIHES